MVNSAEQFEYGQRLVAEVGDIAELAAAGKFERHGALRELSPEALAGAINLAEVVLSEMPDLRYPSPGIEQRLQTRSQPEADTRRLSHALLLSGLVLNRGIIRDVFDLKDLPRSQYVRGPRAFEELVEEYTRDYGYNFIDPNKHLRLPMTISKHGLAFFMNNAGDITRDNIVDIVRSPNMQYRPGTFSFRLMQRLAGDPGATYLSETKEALALSFGVTKRDVAESLTSMRADKIYDGAGETRLKSLVPAGREYVMLMERLFPLG